MSLADGITHGCRSGNLLAGNVENHVARFQAVLIGNAVAPGDSSLTTLVEELRHQIDRSNAR
jgi:hypothetical protein